MKRKNKKQTQDIITSGIQDRDHKTNPTTTTTRPLSLAAGKRIVNSILNFLVCPIIKTTSELFELALIGMNNIFVSDVKS